jgi:hypothetical protein
LPTPKADTKIVESKGDHTSQKESFLTKNAVAILSVFIAFISLLFAMYQGYKTRENYRLNSVPKILINVVSKDLDINIYFKNGGLGPAIIDNIHFNTKGDRSYNTNNLRSKFWFKIFFENNIPDSIYSKYLTHAYTSPETFFPAKEDLAFLKIISKGIDSSSYFKIINLLNGSTIKIEYHSLYQEKSVDSLKFDEINILSN